MNDRDSDESDFSEISQQPAAPARLRDRIMASGYRYQVLDEKDVIDMDLDFRERRDNWHQRTEKTACLRGVITLLGLLSLALLVALVFVVSKRAEGGSAQAKENTAPQLSCSTAECVQTAGAILSRMRLDADPCSDMYTLACGAWLKDATIPPGQSSWSMFGEVALDNQQKIRQLLEAPGAEFKGRNSSAVSKVKQLYNICMDEETVEALGTRTVVELMSELGFWTVSPPPEEQKGWDPDHWSVERSVTKIHKLINAGLFSFSVTKDPTVAGKNVIGFSQPGLTLADRTQYKEESGKFKDGFLGFGVKVAVLLGGIEDEATVKMTEVFEFEKNLSMILAPKSELLDSMKTNRKFNLSDFQSMLGSWIDIKSYLSNIYDGREFSNDTEVIVATPTYFQKLETVLDHAGDEAIANYMMWTVVQSVLPYLPQAFSRAALDLQQVESGVTSLWERWKRCLSFAEGAAGLASSALYVDKYFSQASKVKVTTALQQIKAQFIDNLKTVVWLDDVTRSRLKVKAKAVDLMVGYPDWILDVDKLDERYEKLVVAKKEYLTSALYAYSYARNRELEEIDKKPDSTEWEMRPDEVNAYYQPEFNQVVVPAGILQPPFFSPHYPDSLLYGTIGMIVGHELTHGFDTRGRVYDQAGILNDQWSDEAGEGFNKVTACMSDQYSAYSYQDVQLDGRLTLSENIADNGGLKLALRAFNAQGGSSESPLPGLNLTDHQLFFLGFSQLWCAVYTPEAIETKIKTDLHSVGQFRVTGVLANSQAYAKAFNCDVGATLNPDKKCEVW